METKMESVESCAAIMEQKDSKGKRCWRPVSKDGYCGKHQNQALLAKEKAAGKKKCFRYRCNNMIDESDTKKYCDNCKKKKEEYLQGVKLCKALKHQHENKGKPCGLRATDGDYCGKHTTRQKLLESAKEENINICDDGKRACKNPTSNGKVKCEECLAKKREVDNAIYLSRQLDITKCLGCGGKIDSTLKGHRGRPPQQCLKCYEKQRAIEEKREHEKERDYNLERLNNIERYMNEYIDSAFKKGKPFRLTKEQFTEIVTKACVYCGFKSNSVIGIDRIFSDSGYTVENTVSCCSKCNIIKNSLTPSYLLEHILLMSSHMLVNKEAIEKEERYRDILERDTGKSWLRPGEITILALDGKLEKYIEECKADKRSPAFISKMEELQTKKLPHTELLAFVKNSLRTESNKEKKNTNNTRQRMNKEELFGFLEINAPEKFVEHYEAAHGEQEGLTEEVSSLLKTWTSDLSKENKHILLGKSLTRLQNKRNRANGGK